jgi:hypothetical protein
VLEVAELARVALASKMEVVAHLLTTLVHAGFERVGGSTIPRRERLVESLLPFIEIDVLLLDSC